MTVAALESLTLRRHLRRALPPPPLAFLRDIAKDIDAPWDFAAVADLGYPAVKGHRSVKTRVVNAYISRLQKAAVHDAELTAAFIRVAGLIDPPSALLRPGIALRVLKKSRRPAPAESKPHEDRAPAPAA
jgi:hypothetical protein